MFKLYIDVQTQIKNEFDSHIARIVKLINRRKEFTCKIRKFTYYCSVCHKHDTTQVGLIEEIKDVTCKIRK